MSYCEGDTKARVVYSFNGVERIFETGQTPLDVTVESKRVNATENYRQEGYTIRFYSPNNRGHITALVRDYIIFPLDDDYFGRDSRGISFWNCEAVDFQRHSNGSYAGPVMRLGTLEVIQNGDKCPTPLKNRCNIQVKYKNTVIFQDQGECPINFRVECGDCPKDCERVEIPEYPGYKCIEKCPPETCCECDCGDVICCYGNQGQVLKTIRK